MLGALRELTLEQAGNDDQRQLLARRLDAQMRDAGEGIRRHVAAQSTEWQRDTANARLALIRNTFELEPDDDDKLIDLGEAYASAAIELARINGDPDGGRAAVTQARSSLWRSTIDRRLAAGQGPQALALFDRVRPQLTPADRSALAPPLQNAALDGAADQWIARETSKSGEPLLFRAIADPDLSPQQKVTVLAKVVASDSARERARVAAVKNLDDRQGTAIRVLFTTPGIYKPGTLAAIGEAYEAASEPDKAAAARGYARQETFLLPFAQASVADQQHLIDMLPEEVRDIAQAIQRQQAEAFAKDAFAAGTALYADVGHPVPMEDLEGRIEQARKIVAARGGDATVIPFTADEIAVMRRQLADGTEQECEAVLARFAALPEDMEVLAPVPTAIGKSAGLQSEVQSDTAGPTGRFAPISQNVVLATDTPGLSVPSEEDEALVVEGQLAQTTPAQKQGGPRQSPKKGAPGQPPPKKPAPKGASKDQLSSKTKQPSPEEAAQVAERNAMLWINRREPLWDQIVRGQPNTRTQPLLPDNWKKTLNRNYVAWTEDAAKRYDIPVELLARLFYKESMYNPNAKSKAGYKGIAQLGPSALDSIGIKGDFKYFDAEKSIYAGAAYLKWIYRQVRDWPAAVAAYNAGIGNVKNWMAGAETAYGPNGETTQAIRHVFRGNPKAFD